uniref:60S ribosomal protein L29-1 n=1 Tax=Rhizophora mucronata TaxID=61149 RepID=A0A2P2L8F5_RHIMU
MSNLRSENFPRVGLPPRCHHGRERQRSHQFTKSSTLRQAHVPFISHLIFINGGIKRLSKAE